MHEAATRWVVLVFLHHLTGEVTCRCELQPLGGWQRSELVSPLVGVAALPLRDIDDGESTEALDGYTATPFGKLVAYLVENGRQHLFHRGTGDAGTFDYLTDEVFFVFSWS